MNHLNSYHELQRLFRHQHFAMPSEAYEMGDIYEYRCPYRSVCPANARCFIIATPAPLAEDTILNVSCRLYGGKKIPVYAGKPSNISK